MGRASESAKMTCVKSVFLLRISCLDASVTLSHSSGLHSHWWMTTQPRELLNTDLKFFYCFSLRRVPWFPRMTCALHHLGADTARCPTTVHITHFPIVEPILFNLALWLIRKWNRLDFPASLAVGGCLGHSPGQWDVRNWVGLPHKALIMGWTLCAHRLGLLLFDLLSPWNIDAVF